MKNALEPVVTDDRIYRCRAELSSQFPDVPIHIKSPVRVYGEDDRLLGFGTVKRGEFGGLVAELSLVYSSPERLLIETGEPLYVWIVGDLRLNRYWVPGLANNGSAGIDLSAPIKVISLTIDELLISRKPTQNYETGRLVALGEV